MNTVDLAWPIPDGHIHLWIRGFQPLPASVYGQELAAVAAACEALACAVAREADE